MISVTAVEPLISPAYDTGASEAEISALWQRRHLGRWFHHGHCAA